MQKIGSVMVVGGGVAGMQAALDLAASGYYAYLVEKSGAIGGAMAQLDRRFPMVPLMRMTAASVWPTGVTVLVCTMESYWR